MMAIKGITVEIEERIDQARIEDSSSLQERIKRSKTLGLTRRLPQPWRTTSEPQKSPNSSKESTKLLAHSLLSRRKEEYHFIDDVQMVGGGFGPSMLGGLKARLPWALLNSSRLTSALGQKPDRLYVKKEKLLDAYYFYNFYFKDNNT